MQNLVLLACPVGMGAMMWLMSRGTRDKKPGSQTASDSTIEALRDEHRRLGEELARLEGDQAREPVHAA